MHLGLRELVFLAVLLAVPVGSYFYVFQPRNERIAEAKAEIMRKQSRLDELAEMAAKLDDIGLEIEKGRDAIERVEEKLPGEQHVEGILEQVWQLAKRNRLMQRSLKVEEPVPAAMYMELPLTVRMEGDFKSFYQFLLELEELPRITRVPRMNLLRVGEKASPDQQDLAPGAMQAEFTLSIYFEPQAQTAS